MYAKANSIMDGLKDDPTVEVKQDSWEWLEDYDGSPQEAGIVWFYPLNLCDITKVSGDLRTFSGIDDGRQHARESGLAALHLPPPGTGG